MVNGKAQDKRVTVNNTQLRYLDWGTEGKPLLICLHGHTGEAHIWDEFAEAMSPYFHVLAIDQRGHGDSQWSADGYERDLFVADLAAFMDVLSLGKVTLVGLSMGGWNSILYTPNHPERVERIILVDIAPDIGKGMKENRAPRPPTPLEFDSLEDAISLARQNNLWVTDERLRRDIMARIRQRDDGKWVWKADPKLMGGTLRDTEPEFVARSWRSFEAIKCPILEIRGTESPAVSDELLEDMTKANSQFSFVDVEGAGHVVCVDKPQEFIEAARVFLGVAV
jgi:pimeloyl-ACP methyl ester carboxylesterase